jgi:hypothetical protein
MTYKTGKNLVEEAKQRIDEVSPDEVKEMQVRNEAVVYLDVREPNEWNLGQFRSPGIFPADSSRQKSRGWSIAIRRSSSTARAETAQRSPL